MTGVFLSCNKLTCQHFSCVDIYQCVDNIRGRKTNKSTATKCTPMDNMKLLTYADLAEILNTPVNTRRIQI
jgi:hypothetical protein